MGEIMRSELALAMSLGMSLVGCGGVVDSNSSSTGEALKDAIPIVTGKSPMIIARRAKDEHIWTTGSDTTLVTNDFADEYSWAGIPALMTWGVIDTFHYYMLANYPSENSFDKKDITGTRKLGTNQFSCKSAGGDAISDADCSGDEAATLALTEPSNGSFGGRECEDKDFLGHLIGTRTDSFSTVYNVTSSADRDSTYGHSHRYEITVNYDSWGCELDDVYSVSLPYREVTTDWFHVLTIPFPQKDLENRIIRVNSITYDEYPVLGTVVPPSGSGSGSGSDSGSGS